MDVQVKFTVQEGARAPSYQSVGASGADVCALLATPVTISPLGRALIKTGVSVEIPPGYEIQVRPRSGLALRHGITVLNSPGTVDSDYRGEIGVVLVNLGEHDFTVSNGDRIAQLVLAPVSRAEFVGSDSLSATGRGSLGYGSTGK